ncbi:MAG: farnesyl diphosphate synthase [Pseudomonadota bacterium]
MDDFSKQWQTYRHQVDRALEKYLADPGLHRSRLHDAMRYVCLGGGKRIRATLVYACGEVARGDRALLDVPAAAIEMVHAYSLTHDDLPCMDDDDLRRGKATCHLQFDEATAVLTGDALQCRAFELVADDETWAVGDHCRLSVIRTLSSAAGAAGMVGGQQMDIEATHQKLDIHQLQSMHKLKTGALIQAAAMMGILTAGEQRTAYLQAIWTFASHLGLTFQIVDDILDATASSEELGKTAGADAKLEKSTYVTLLGLDQAIEEADRNKAAAIESLDIFGDNAEFLIALTEFVRNRSH